MKEEFEVVEAMTMVNLFNSLLEERNELLSAIEKLRKVKSRYHTEQAFTELVALADNIKEKEHTNERRI